MTNFSEPKLTNSLTDLADRVRIVMDESTAAEATAIDKAIEAGSLLCEAKDRCEHGAWLPFLSRSGTPERKAQRYMKLARSGIKSDTVSDLGGIKAALRWCEKLRLPNEEECLAVWLDGLDMPTFAGVWKEGDGYWFSVLSNPEYGMPGSPILTSEFVLPAVYEALGCRFKKMQFYLMKQGFIEDLAEIEAALAELEAIMAAANTKLAEFELPPQ